MKTISSPNTDFLALLVVLYVLSKWMREVETNRRDLWGKLCIITIWGITVKLSILPLILLIIKPIYIYIKQHNWKKIVFIL